MNHSKAPALHVRRAVHIPRLPIPKTDNPLVLRRTYHITAACGRQKDADDGAVMMQMHLTRSSPLWRCIAIGAAAVGITAAVIGICRAKRQLLIRRKYARRYAERLKLVKQHQKQQLSGLRREVCVRRSDSMHDGCQKP